MQFNRLWDKPYYYTPNQQFMILTGHWLTNRVKAFVQDKQPSQVEFRAEGKLFGSPIFEYDSREDDATSAMSLSSMVAREFPNFEIRNADI